ncbi:MAG: tRNA 4-thiouridine(8) synthase ThiI [Lachnospiraceae bacterium]|nr:tRNA 4-thiouridine(8) synthase ThiI [Lachnospiraceae bacterium]
MYKAFLIKYSEIGIKGKNRYVFEDALVRNIREAIADCDGVFEVTKERGRIYIEVQSEYDYDELIDALTKVFGIAAICPVVLVEDKSWDNLCKEACDFVKAQYGDKSFTFKVEARRSDKNYPMTSPEMGIELGAYLLDRFPNMQVDVHNPEVRITIEIRDRAYIYSKSIPGLQGMPVGTSGKAMLLLSGGIDSPVAGYMIAKRGVKLEAVYFHAPPYTSDRAKKKVVDLAKKVAVYSGTIRLHVINFTEIQMAIYEKCPHDELTIIMRRYMMRIAEKIALENDCLGLVTGESIGQVASQTMHSLRSTNEVCELPVYRPLIAFDKQDIIEISQRIDAFETSIQPYEDCCTIFVAKHPVTKPNVNVIRKSETKLEDIIDDMLETAYATDEIIEITK